MRHFEKTSNYLIKYNMLKLLLNLYLYSICFLHSFNFF